MKIYEFLRTPITLHISRRRTLILLVGILLVLVVYSSAFLLYSNYKEKQRLIEERRQTLINIAIDYEKKAGEAQAYSDAAWEACIITHAELLESLAKEKQDLASEYRQQALKYRELATK